MRDTMENNRLKKIISIFVGIGGISLVIMIHELGHFLFAQFFNVPAPLFSIGFGPALWSFPIGQTTFQIALLPLGGYVELDQYALALQPYMHKMLIVFAGVLFNILFAGLIFLYYALNKKPTLPENTSPTDTNNNPSVIGPIGIITMIGESLTISPHLFWTLLSILSLNIGLFNILPLPFLDGGKALIFTIEAIMGKTISPTLLWYVTITFLALFMIFIGKVSVNDLKRLTKK